MTDQIQTQGLKLIERRHQEMIDDIQNQLKHISTLIEREAQRKTYNWADIGDLGYIQEQLQRITDFSTEL